MSVVSSFAIPSRTSMGQCLTCGVHPVKMGDGAAGMRAEVPAALVVEVAARGRRQAAHVIMVLMVIEGMDGMSANYSCGFKRTWRFIMREGYG